MPGIKELLLRQPPSPIESRRSDVQFKPISAEFSDMSKSRDIEPAKDTHNRLIKINNMLHAYERLSQRQFAHFIEDMIHIKGGNASMDKGLDDGAPSEGNKHLIQTAEIGKDVTLISEAGIFAGPDVQCFIYRELDKMYSEGVSFKIIEKISIFSHDPSQQPQVKRWVSPKDGEIKPGKEAFILNDLRLEKEALLSPEKLHYYADEVLSIYTSTLPSSD